MTAALALAAATLALAGPAGSQARPVVALTAAPARLALEPSTEGAVTLRNLGAGRIVVRASAGNYAVDVRGRPRVVPRRAARRSAASWLAVSPRELTLGPGAAALVRVRAVVPRRAEPGDHSGLVLLATRSGQPGGVGVRMRVGIRVVVRVPGAVVRRLAVERVRVRRAPASRMLDVRLTNRGNVTELLTRAGVTVELVRGRVLQRLAAAQRELLPGTSAVFSVRYRGTLRGRVLARVSIRGRPARAFWLRL